MDKVLEVRNLSKRYGKGCPACFAKTGPLFESNICPDCGSVVAIHDISFDLYRGEILGIMGESGAGKSTVLKGIYRTYLPSQGRILYTAQNGEVIDLARAGEHQILDLRRHEIAFVTQFLHCLPRQPTEDVVAQPLVQRGRPIAEARALARELLAAMKLPEPLWGISPATFSGGEKQRVNLARGLVAKPRLLLLDEPTASLDPDATDRVVKLIEDLKSDGVAMLAVLHQPELVARMADDVVTLHQPIMTQPPLEERVG
ncbi:MAG: ATP-binding cassette domain-containing protein [Candidatus Competibacteraceae bacterium]|jgi:alpha-D-ribose 1-methylphosphonate 5-triphosphate synthase subunit PhnL|nr:ATP-binding cassette domain-containing protein [Candidatus Competibacteraceae bacterium]